MIELDECREDGDGELLSLYCEGWVDKATFRDTCVRWLADGGYYVGIERRIERGLDGFFDPHAAKYLAAPEPEHIEHLRWRLVPLCIWAFGSRCSPDCDCPLLFMRCKDRGPGKRYTVWDVDDARQRYYDAKREAERDE